ncbi:MAG: GNAT family N-acetyltransferase [Chloroflexota bacterium]
MVDLVHYSSEQMPPDLAAQFNALYEQVFLEDGNDDDGMFELPDAPGRRLEHFMVVEGDQLVSHADVSERIISHRGETYKLRGIGEVMTDPNFRRTGHAQRAVAAASDYICTTDADIGMLFTMPELESFYGSSGWITINTQGVTFGDPDQPRFDDAYVMMLLLSDKAKAHRADFEHGPIYVGHLLW